MGKGNPSLLLAGRTKKEGVEGRKERGVQRLARMCRERTKIRKVCAVSVVVGE